MFAITTVDGGVEDHPVFDSKPPTPSLVEFQRGRASAEAKSRARSGTLHSSDSLEVRSMCDFFI